MNNNQCASCVSSSVCGWWVEYGNKCLRKITAWTHAGCREWLTNTLLLKLRCDCWQQPPGPDTPSILGRTLNPTPIRPWPATRTKKKGNPNSGDMLRRREITFETVLHNRQPGAPRGHTFTAMCSFIKKQKTKNTKNKNHDKWRLESTPLCSNSYRFHYMAVTTHPLNADVGSEHCSFLRHGATPPPVTIGSINGTSIENTPSESSEVNPFRTGCWLLWGRHIPPPVFAQMNEHYRCDEHECSVTCVSLLI